MKLKWSVTNLLIMINVAIFLSAFFTNNVYRYIVVLGLNSPFNYGPVAYITSAFMHGSLMHLAFNMLFLHMIGPVYENFLGVRNYLIYYFGMAIGSGFLTSIFSNSVTIGASGVLFAMITTLIVMDKYGGGRIRVANVNGLAMILVLNLVLSVVLRNVSLIGHVSGIVVGIIAAMIIMSLEERGWLRWMIYKKKY